MSKITQYTPTSGYLLVKPKKQSQSSGISITSDEWDQLGEVVAVGDPSYVYGTDILKEAPCRVGDEIFHSSTGYENVRMEGKQYRIVPFNKVLLVK